MGAYGNPDARTPVLDRLAREGVLFRNALVTTPVCSPSRAGFLTGRYGTELGIRDWISPDEAASGLGLPPGTATWPAILRERGWRTALVGKWHLGRTARTLRPSASSASSASSTVATPRWTRRWRWRAASRS